MATKEASTHGMKKTCGVVLWGTLTVCGAPTFCTPPAGCHFPFHPTLDREMEWSWVHWVTTQVR